MKLYVILNEKSPRAHSDVYHAMDYLKQKGIINEYQINPFEYHLQQGLTQKNLNTNIMDECKEFLPDIILWMHTDSFDVSDHTINYLKRLDSHPVIGYWDGDLYESPYRPAPKELLELASRCDVVFLQGYNEVAEQLLKKGTKDIRFVPSFGDERFYSIERKEENIEYNVVMIGNNIQSRNPFRLSMNGTKLRNRVIYYFSKKLGTKFAVYGNGWKGSFAKGPIGYNEQSKIYHKSKIAIRINNYSGKYYFSDGLPIAMLSGIPIVHNYEEGFDELWKSNPGLKFFKSVDEAWELTELLLSKNINEINEIGYNLSKYALNNLTHLIVFKYMVNVLKNLCMKNKGQIDTVEITNYWHVKSFTE